VDSEPVGEGVDLGVDGLADLLGERHVLVDRIDEQDAGLAVGGASTGQAPAGAAPRCADVHVLFARGTVETAPPLGLTGIAFTNAVRGRLPGKSVRVEAVRYAASANFSNKLAFAHSFIRGVESAQRRMRSIAAACPDTDIVLGGYSQGAALAQYAVSAQVQVPERYQRYRSYVPRPLAAYRGKTVRYCIQGDTICNGARLGGPNALHLLYSVNGMADQGARYVARRV